LAPLRHRPEGLPRRSLDRLSSLTGSSKTDASRGDGHDPHLIASLSRADLLVLDDFGLEPLDAGARHDLLEILEDQSGLSSMATS
jgi:DNA replication protein DnaC